MEGLSSVNLPAVGVLTTFLVIWSGLMLWAVRGFIGRLERKLDDEIARFNDVERELKALQIALPKEYVRREDWIRFGAVIDAKIDRLHDKVDLLAVTFGGRDDAT